MTKQCFVLTPFGSPFDDYYRRVLAPAIKAAGLEPKRADEIYGPRPIIDDIVEGILNSVALVADVTGRNPNVNYELGLAHAFGRPVVIISQSIDDIPFDYRHVRAIIYDVQDLDWTSRLGEKVTKSLENSASFKPLVPSPVVPSDSRTDLSFYSTHEEAFSRIEKEICLKAQARNQESTLLVRVLGTRGRYICPWLQGFIHRYEDEAWFSQITFRYYLIDSSYAQNVQGLASHVQNIEAGAQLVKSIGRNLEAKGSSVGTECLRYRSHNPFQAFLVGKEVLMLSFFRPRVIHGDVIDWIGPSRNGYYFFELSKKGHDLAIGTIIDWTDFLETISDKAPNPGPQPDGYRASRGTAG